MAGKWLALGDVKALLGKVIGMERMLDVFEDANLHRAQMASPVVDGQPIDQWREQIWAALRRMFPAQPDAALREGRAITEEESPSAYVATQLQKAVIQLKALEIAKDLNIPPTEFKASFGWCRRMMRRNGLSLRRRTSLAQRLPSDFREKWNQTPPYLILKRKTVPKEAMPAGIISIVNGFKKCCISNAMDGSEDDVLWEEAEPGDAQPEKVSDESDDSESGPSDAEDAAQ
ncbi:hypothetical protein AAFF_G00192770 [Aldrovandia affinis]|uniref:HTH CENPB-type domain-containing protein n=1 Tax=Aldrovandia affinis TaxID=143900 RepID=A0AAD7W5L7_9TELE|nr:hypothetical protein AAFF_G00192770 [Aldrovandia affinis]